MNSEIYINLYLQIKEIINELKIENINLSDSILKKFNSLDLDISREMSDEEHSKIDFDKYPNF